MIRTYDPVEGVASAQGLDVSNYQGRYDWAAAKHQVPGLCFGFYRLTEGLPGAGNYNSPDPDAAWNHAQIRDQGIPHRGAYHVLHPSLSGRDQAQYFVAQHEHLGLVLRDILICDHELTDGEPPPVVAACARDFMSELVALRPHNPQLLYTFLDFAKSGYCEGLGNWPLDLANTSGSAPPPPPPWVAWKVWQWGQREGIDADAFNGTAEAMTAWVESFLPPQAGPPYRHLTRAGETMASIAASRGTTPDHLFARSAAEYTPEDLAALGRVVLPAGVPYYTANP